MPHSLPCLMLLAMDSNATGALALASSHKCKFTADDRPAVSQGFVLK